jgi:imidazole glycerol-phosphate synthase subunit HisF
LVKTVRFANPTYIGDPINAVRIFNDKGADELLVLDIDATAQGRPPSYQEIEQLAGECFMPLAYGGGIRTADEVRQLIRLGVEKCVLNAAAAENPHLISEAADVVGSQSVVVSIDAVRTMFGRYHTVIRNARTKTGQDPVEAARAAVSRGAGEIVLTAVDREGSMKGYDIELIRSVAAAVDVPVVANGGAGSVSDFVCAAQAGASAVAAGSMFVFKGRHRAVLINVPTEAELAPLYEIQA